MLEIRESELEYKMTCRPVPALDAVLDIWDCPGPDDPYAGVVLRVVTINTRDCCFLHYNPWRVLETSIDPAVGGVASSVRPDSITRLTASDNPVVPTLRWAARGLPL